MHDCTKIYTKALHSFPSQKASDAISVVMFIARKHDDVIKWKHFPRYWPFVQGIHRSPVNSPHKGQWRGALMFTLICARINGWVNNREAGDLRRYRGHYDVIVLKCYLILQVHCDYLPDEGQIHHDYRSYQNHHHCRVGAELPAGHPCDGAAERRCLINTQNCRHLADEIFTYISLNENAWISLKISLKFVPKVRINNSPALVQIMACRRPGDKPFSEPKMVSLLTQICVTRP